MPLPFKPMLSADLAKANNDLSTLRYPLLVSPKLDGLRCILWEGVAYSRNGEPFRNRFVQKWARDFHNLDGELIVGSAADALCLNTTQSGIMSFEGEPDFKFHIFDSMERITPAFQDSYGRGWPEDERIVLVPHYMVHDRSALLAFEERWLSDGYEGVMLRAPDGPYKHGRSTLKEGWLIKLKRFTDGEAVVTGIEEGSHNDNALERDALGRAKRSRTAAGLRGNEMVGTILARDPQWGELRVAPGKMTHEERRIYFEHPEYLIGQTIHWRSFGYGVKEKPRFPRFYGVYLSHAPRP